MNGLTLDGKQLMWEDEASEVLRRFYKLCDAVFWSMVWTKRSSVPNPEESTTALRLGAVEAAMDAGAWEEATSLLAIGAPHGALTRREPSVCVGPR